ncbi:hypothetical protein AGR4A_pAt10351 [Agrobacterium tumefaciens str. B6]|uniref:Uncharacterized protein n=1 Tax=Agrobacterium tumefaciens str. B6 TaxID=1183423 RepID=A0A822VDS3_AGRTU|nr:hypothetical protein AGR4A_pAt10351 [Agrobacterium tumefaciens str. B6]
MVAALRTRHVLSEDGRVKSSGWKDGSMTYDTMIGIDLAIQSSFALRTEPAFCSVPL